MTKIFIKKDKLKQKTLKDSTIDLRDNLDVKQKKSFKKWFFVRIRSR